VQRDGKFRQGQLAMIKSETLRTFVLQYLDRFDHSGGGGTIPRLPDFELYAQDYLAFAEQELITYQNDQAERRKTARLINCIAHLKRAIDCELDTFLHVYNLYRIFADRNLKFEKKLDFLAKAGVFSSRSLARLNTMRNKMEHKFEVPKIDDIEVYYDLTSAFIAILQRTIISSLYSELEISICGQEDTEGNYVGIFRIAYDFETPSIEASWSIDGVAESLHCDMSEPIEFGFFLRVLLLLHQQESFASNRYVTSQLSQ
jgi:hypothetical protein